MNAVTNNNGVSPSSKNRIGKQADEACMKYIRIRDLENDLSKTDVSAGITTVVVKGVAYYDYTKFVMKKINEAENEFIQHKMVGNTLNDLATDAINGLTGRGISQLLWFYNEVNHFGPWDIKEDTPWKETFGDQVKMSMQGEDIVFRNKVVNRADLGNITYGYLGTAMGLQDIILFAGGGLANSVPKNDDGTGKSLIEIVQYIANNPDVISLILDESKNYGDLPEDVIKVQEGINLYNSIH